MSPRAALRLERLGYGPVYDYFAGKVDWLAAGLPSEGEGSRERRAVDVVEEAFTCALTTSAGDATRSAQAADEPSVLVVDDDGILAGRFHLDRAADPEEAVESLMEPGPVTVRANEPLDALLERMRSRGVTEVVVTTPNGRLLGVVRRATR